MFAGWSGFVSSSFCVLTSTETTRKQNVRVIQTVLREWLLNSEGRGVFGRRGRGWEVESSQQCHHRRTGSWDWGLDGS